MKEKKQINEVIKYVSKYVTLSTWFRALPQMLLITRTTSYFETHSSLPVPQAHDNETYNGPNESRPHLNTLLL